MPTLTPKLKMYRIAVLAGLCLFIVLLAAMVANLAVQMRDAARTATDNPQWTILQLDLEFANLDTVLTDQLCSRPHSEQDVRLRVDILLSRIDIIQSGRTALVFGGNAQATRFFGQLNMFAADTVAVMDAPGPLSDAALVRLQRDVRELRPVVRDIALLGNTLGLAMAKSQRETLTRQLVLTGSFTIALLFLMALLMLVLDRLLRRAERRDAALSASTKQLASTVAASLDAIVTADVDGRIVGFNTAAERVFGWSRNEIVGQLMDQTIIPHDMRNAHREGMKRYLRDGHKNMVDAGRVELCALRKSGEEFPVELNITSSQKGDDITFISYIRDISERKINEQRLIDARNQAERTDRAKSRFLTWMSHEMRTPLNGILGVLDLLKTTNLDAQQKRYASVATASGEVLLEHVNEALDITRIETGNLQLTEQDFDLAELIKGLFDMFAPLASEKELGLSWTVDVPARGSYVGDSGRIRQVLTNLLGNAIKFTDAGHISLGVTAIHGADASSLRFEVSDTGVGIPCDEQEQVFEDFFARTPQKGRQSRSDGLGLPISRRMARAMGGDVSVKSKEGEGSVFVLALTLKRSCAAAPNMQSATGQPQNLIPKRRVLIVEDNAINRSVLEDMLVSLGHDVATAVHGADAVLAADTKVFDVIFMDISMPDMDGIEATHLLRAQNGPNAKTQIIGLTAHGREEVREAAIFAGMDDFYTKPLRLDVLHRVFANMAKDVNPPVLVGHGDALTEMLAMLGEERVRSSVRDLFAELTDLTVQVGALDGSAGARQLVETVHKIAGAAALFGQAELASVLAELESDLRADHFDNANNWVSRLQAETQSARHSIEATLRHGG